MLGDKLGYCVYPLSVTWVVRLGLGFNREFTGTFEAIGVDEIQYRRRSPNT